MNVLEQLRELTTPVGSTKRELSDPKPFSVLVWSFLGAQVLGQTRAEKVVLTVQPFVMSAAATYGAYQGAKHLSPQDLRHDLQHAARHIVDALEAPQC